MDITANSVTASQLEAYMAHLVEAGATTATVHAANQDQWCFCLAAVLGSPCPAYDIGNGPGVMTSAQEFLDGLRNWQLGQNASNPGPGGSETTVASLPPVAAVTAASSLGVGLFGPTNCKFCIWLKANPWVILVAVAAIYFGFFYKKS
jgi:hypothetical protein